MSSFGFVSLSSTSAASTTSSSSSTTSSSSSSQQDPFSSVFVKQAESHSKHELELTFVVKFVNLYSKLNWSFFSSPLDGEYAQVQRILALCQQWMENDEWSFDAFLDSVLHVLSGVNDECWAYCATRHALFTVKEQDAIQHNLKLMLSPSSSS